MTETETLLAEIAELKRQNADLQAENQRQALTAAAEKTLTAAGMPAVLAELVMAKRGLQGLSMTADGKARLIDEMRTMYPDFWRK